MGLRLKQRIKVFPGVHLNISLSGMSVSMGGPGATVNIGKGMRVRGTIGLPGTGLSYHSTLHPGAGNMSDMHSTEFSAAGKQACSWQNELEEGSIQPQPVSQALSGYLWTPPELMPIQNLIIEAHQERRLLDKEVEQLQQHVASAHAHLEKVNTLWGRWFYRKRIHTARVALKEAQNAHEHVQQLQHQQGIPISWSMDEELQRRYAQFAKDMRSLLQQAQGWHLLGMTHAASDNRAWHSSLAMHRTSCTVGFAHPTFFCTQNLPPSVPCIKCADELALYFYPAFILVQHGDAFGLLSPKELCIDVDNLRVAEHDSAYASIPTDEYTWRYVNKNGTPDQRYSHNPQVPLIEYQRLALSGGHGLNETFLFIDGAYAFASWLGVQDWYRAREIHAELHTLAYCPAQWAVRSESDAHYFVAQHENKEIFGFGLTKNTGQFWICLNTEPLGVVIDSNCIFDFWVDERHLELGKTPGVTRRIGCDDAAFQVIQEADETGTTYIQKCLGSAKDVLIQVQRNGTPTVRLRLAMMDPSPFWNAIDPGSATQ